jgi:hypothetical protein
LCFFEGKVLHAKLAKYRFAKHNQLCLVVANGDGKAFFIPIGIYGAVVVAAIDDSDGLAKYKCKSKNEDMVN